MIARSSKRLFSTIVVLLACLGLVALTPARTSATRSTHDSPTAALADKQPPDPTIDTSALALPVREIRTIVPNGKDDARFGVIGKRPDGILEASATPLSVRLLATKPPRVNEAINLVLQVHAFQDAPGTIAEIQLPAGAKVLSGATLQKLDLAAGQTAEVAASVVFPQGGELSITGRALKEVSPQMTWGDSDSLYLTVGDDVGKLGFKASGTAELAAGQSSDKLDNTQLKAPADEDGVPLAEPKRADAQAEKQALPTPSSGPVVAVSICWTLGSDRDGSVPPLRDAYIELWDRDGGADDLLYSSHTGYYNGCTTAYVGNHDDDEGGLIDVYWRVYTRSLGRWRVMNFGGGIYNCTTSTTYNVSVDTSYGTWWCGGTGGGNDGSVLIANDLYRTHRFLNEHAVSRGMGGYPGLVLVQWQPDSTDGTYYSLGDGLVHLAGADAQSRDTVVHETNHRFMHLMYSTWPPSDCPSPHFINGSSGPGCAWSEGYTYAVVAGVDGNPIYTWPSGASIDLETPDCNTPGFDDGPDVEGRVGGVLIDLMDPFTLSFGTVSGFSNESGSTCGDDEVSGMFDAVWDLVYDQDDQVIVAQSDGNGGTYTDSFSNAWEARDYPRYAPHNVGHLNSIYYFTHD
jgi:hypothetical protein